LVVFLVKKIFGALNWCIQVLSASRPDINQAAGSIPELTTLPAPKPGTVHLKLSTKRQNDLL